MLEIHKIITYNEFIVNLQIFNSLTEGQKWKS